VFFQTVRESLPHAVPTPSPVEDDVMKTVLIYQDVNWVYKDLLGKQLVSLADHEYSFTSKDEKLAIISHKNEEEARKTIEKLMLEKLSTHDPLILRLRAGDIKVRPPFLAYLFAPSVNEAQVTSSIPKDILHRNIRKRKNGSITISFFTKVHLQQFLKLGFLKIEEKEIPIRESFLSEGTHQLWVGNLHTDAKVHHIKAGIAQVEGPPQPKRIDIIRDDNNRSKGCAWVFFDNAKEMLLFMEKPFAVEGKWTVVDVPLRNNAIKE
jgi:hypothetical protein